MIICNDNNIKVGLRVTRRKDQWSEGISCSMIDYDQVFTITKIIKDTYNQGDKKVILGIECRDEEDGIDKISGDVYRFQFAPKKINHQKLTVKKVNKILLKRYDSMLSNTIHLQDIRKMCQVALNNLKKWPVDKTSRWIGYIQANLISAKFTTVIRERDYSRPLFHAAYNNKKKLIPESINIE